MVISHSWAAKAVIWPNGETTKLKNSIIDTMNLNITTQYN
ncbi:hypothetical protein PPHE_b0885 [Pseudoalteromonas phenolica O-BC30]|nr:hypothetical protein [Pseudoalteromonas phenolica O-BC30]